VGALLVTPMCIASVDDQRGVQARALTHLPVLARCCCPPQQPMLPLTCCLRHTPGAVRDSGGSRSRGGAVAAAVGGVGVQPGGSRAVRQLQRDGALQPGGVCAAPQRQLSGPVWPAGRGSARQLRLREHVRVRVQPRGCCAAEQLRRARARGAVAARLSELGAAVPCGEHVERCCAKGLGQQGWLLVLTLCVALSATWERALRSSQQVCHLGLPGLFCCFGRFASGV
jgi:hypothetical protein